MLFSFIIHPWLYSLECRLSSVSKKTFNDDIDSTVSKKTFNDDIDSTVSKKK